MKPIDVTSDSYVEYNEDSNEKDCNLKFVIASEYQKKKKKFLLKDTLKNGQKKFFLIVQLKTQYRALMLLVNPVLEVFMKK